MQVEEIEIIVTVKIEKVLKEFKKIAPEIKKIAKQAQESFSNINTKKMNSKINQATQFMKKKIQDLKKSNSNNEVAIKINNKEASKQINQIQKEISSLQKKISERELKLSITNGALDKLREDMKQEVLKESPDISEKGLTQKTEHKMFTNSNSAQMIKESDKLNNEIIKYNCLLDSAKGQMAQLDGETSQTAINQNKMSGFFSEFKQKVTQVIPNISNIKKDFNGLPKITQNMGNNIKRMGNSMKNGVKHVLKYAGSLLSVSGIYGLLGGSAQTWLSSQNVGAQQLSANIEYLKYSMGSIFANIIQYVTNLIYNLMKTVQSLVYAFSGVNIFAKATAGSMKSASGSANKTKEALRGVHTDINNMQESDNGGSGDNISPNMDLSQVDSEMNGFTQKLYDFFKPIIDSWNNYGTTFIESIKNALNGILTSVSIMWLSVEQIITNGTIYSILSNIFNSIGNIGRAWANAWNNENNGTELIQNIADIINEFSLAINNITLSEEFQTFLDGIFNSLTGLSELIKTIVIDFINLAEPITKIATSTIGTVLNFIGDALKSIASNEMAVTLLESLALAIGLVTIATTIFKAIKALETGVLIANAAAWLAMNLPIILIISAITSVVAIIILCVKHWEEIKETIINVCKRIGEEVLQFGENIKKWFFDTIQNIKTNWNNFWENLFAKCGEILNNMIIGISNALNAINTAWNNVWTGIGNVISIVWNGIWGVIKWVINLILGGIEGFVNGTIRGINKLLQGISNVANAVGSLIGLKPINLQISIISLPRLAKGGVLTKATAVIAGEYSGARSNPEIVAPQNILKETFEDVLSNYTGSSGQPMHVTIQYLGKSIFDDTIDYINSKTRRTGKNTIVTVGD